MYEIGMKMKIHVFEKKTKININQILMNEQLTTIFNSYDPKLKLESIYI